MNHRLSIAAIFDASAVLPTQAARARTATLVVATTLLTSLASAQTVTFQVIPGAGFATDITPDGRWVVGGMLDGSGGYRYDRQTDTLLVIGANDAYAVSDDGQIIVGDMLNPGGGEAEEVAGMWTIEDGWQSLGFLTNAGTCPSRSNAFGVSADGAVVTGLSWDGCNGRAFRWTEATGMLEMEVLANGGNRGSAISADGSVLAGFAQGVGSRTPAMWDDEGFGTLLDPPLGAAVGEVRGMSDDGTILLGNWNELAFRWTGGEAETIGAGRLLPGWVGNAINIAEGDGTVVGFDHLFGNRRAWIQPQGAGDLQELKSWAEARGAVITLPLGLHVAYDISDDGTVIVGHTAFDGAWIIEIHAECPGDSNGDGVVNVNDLNNVILDWGTDGSANGGDITGATPGSPPDGIVNVNDLNAVVVNWGACS